MKKQLTQLKKAALKWGWEKEAESIEWQTTKIGNVVYTTSIPLAEIQNADSFLIANGFGIFKVHVDMFWTMSQPRSLEAWFGKEYVEIVFGMVMDIAAEIGFIPIYIAHDYVMDQIKKGELSSNLAFEAAAYYKVDQHQLAKLIKESISAK